jgi:hypothetical protein
MEGAGDEIKSKGQLISKCLFGVIVWTKKPTRMSALASKKSSIKKNKGSLLY